MTKHFTLLLLVLWGCTEVKNQFELPILGRPQITTRIVNGVEVSDTVPHTIAAFSFVNQDSMVVTKETFAGKIYVSDFFFTSCPTICPKMKQQMLRVYDAYEAEPRVSMLSHTIDPEYDTVGLLHEYANRLGVKSDKWHFVTGDKEEIYDIAETSYMVVANQDDSAPGGYIHSGAFLLVDEKSHIRGVYDGTLEAQVDLLIKDIDRLLKSSAL
ncbi:MAG: protein SCO1/2 [Cyclobacteriaceae bacterium]|jgi:protein SCO1/2